MCQRPKALEWFDRLFLWFQRKGSPTFYLSHFSPHWQNLFNLNLTKIRVLRCQNHKKRKKQIWKMGHSTEKKKWHDLLKSDTFIKESTENYKSVETSLYDLWSYITPYSYWSVPRRYLWERRRNMIIKISFMTGVRTSLRFPVSPSCPCSAPGSLPAPQVAFSLSSPRAAPDCQLLRLSLLSRTLAALRCPGQCCIL